MVKFYSFCGVGHLVTEHFGFVESSGELGIGVGQLFKVGHIEFACLQIHYKFLRGLLFETYLFACL